MTATTGIFQDRLFGLISRARSRGRSQSALELDDLRERIREHLLYSLSVRSHVEAALEELDAIRAEAATPGWNGYGAKPIDLESYRVAKAFIETLPTTAPFPEVSVAGDGEVMLDWLFGHRKALTVSVGPNGRLTFAWIDGTRTYRGTDWFEDGIPSTIADAIGRLAPKTIANRRTA